MKRFLWLALLGAYTHLHGQCAGVTSCSAASCVQSVVSTALSSMTLQNTVLTVPAGSCSWASNINFSTALSFSMIGASTIATTNAQSNPATFTDSTLITDTQSGTSGNNPILSITETGSSSQVVRVSGFSWVGGNVVFNGEVVISGALGTQSRFDHMHFHLINGLASAMYQPMNGVFDHNLVDAVVGTTNNGVRIYNEVAPSLGDGPWAANTNFGTVSYIYLENNTFNNGFMNDCEVGGTFVARYNTYNTTAANQNIGIQTHATGSQTRNRGCRAFEVYKNVMGGGGGTVQSSYGFITSGTGLWWGNTANLGSASHDIVVDSDRDNNNTYPQSPTPAGWGYCGTNSGLSGAGSNWDGNTNTVSGYPCLDNVGRGKGDLLSGNFNTVINTTTGTIAWPHQALEPLYIWMETYSGFGSLVSSSSVNGNIVSDQDYYVPATSFNGTTGTGFGLLSGRPSTCTTNTAYWATDQGTQGTLYQCSSTNTWTSYYQPFTYPHPLVGGGGTVGSIVGLGAKLSNGASVK